MFLPNNKSAPTIYLSPANWTKRTLLRRQVHHRRPIARRRSSPTHLPRPARPSSCCKTATTRVPRCNASSLADDARDTHTPYTVYVRRSTRILHHPRMCCAAATTSHTEICSSSASRIFSNPHNYIAIFPARGSQATLIATCQFESEQIIDRRGSHSILILLRAWSTLKFFRNFKGRIS